MQSDGDAIRRVGWVCGAAILARRMALEAVGGFDEELFIYSEDPDLCLRLSEAGYAIAYFPHASLVHHENATTSGVPERRIYQMERSRAIYSRKHHGAAGEYAVRGMTVAAFTARAAAAKALLTVPGGSPAEGARPLRAGADDDPRPRDDPPRCPARHRGRRRRLQRPRGRRQRRLTVAAPETGGASSSIRWMRRVVASTSSIRMRWPESATTRRPSGRAAIPIGLPRSSCD